MIHIPNHTALPSVNSQVAVDLLRRAYDAWHSASDFRKRRERFKRYTYGRQWDDLITLSDGTLITEMELVQKNGKRPLTNNLIRRLVKSVVGKFRAEYCRDNENEAINGISRANALPELDSRLLEEFLISGVALQHIDADSAGVRVDNINPNRFFVNPTLDPRGNDIELIGSFADLPISDVLRRFAHGDSAKARRLRDIYALDNRMSLSSDFGLSIIDDDSFFRPAPGRCRVYEIWHLDGVERLRCHDTKNGDYYALPVDGESALVSEIKRRERAGEPTVNYKWEIAQVWRCSFVSPSGSLLDERVAPVGCNTHPYAVKFYPLTDGEVHSFVEDVIDQQRYVNRLITLIDHVMAASAKGVLLFPEDQKPSNQKWDDVLSAWASYNGVIAYNPKMNMPGPQQVVTNASNIGAYDLLALEMKMFEDISGVTDALQGKDAGRGVSASLYQQQTRNAVIALADIFETFNSFRTSRNAKSLAIASQRWDGMS